MKLVKEILYEKFSQDSDPVYDLGIGVAAAFPEICKSILEHDKHKLFFTVSYKAFGFYTKLNKYFFQIYLNVPRVSSQFKEYHNNEILKKYVKDIISKLGYESIFTDVIITGKFTYYHADYHAEDDTPISRESPNIYCSLNTNIHINKKEIKAQRVGWDLDKINITEE